MRIRDEEHPKWNSSSSSYVLMGDYVLFIKPIFIKLAMIRKSILFFLIRTKKQVVLDLYKQGKKSIKIISFLMMHILLATTKRICKIGKEILCLISRGKYCPNANINWNKIQSVWLPLLSSNVLYYTLETQQVDF